MKYIHKLFMFFSLTVALLLFSIYSVIVFIEHKDNISASLMSIVIVCLSILLNVIIKEIINVIYRKKIMNYEK